MKIKKGNIITGVIGLLLGRVWFYGINPFCIAFAMGAYLQNICNGILFATMLIGIGMCTDAINVIKYGVMLFVSLSAAGGLNEIQNPINKNVVAVVTSTVCFVVNILFLSFFGPRDNIFLESLLQAVIIGTGMLVFEKGILAVKKQRSILDMRNEELLGIGILFCVILSGIPNQIFGINILGSCCYYIVLIVAYKFGLREGAIVGCLSGIVLSYKLENVQLIGVLCLVGVFVGLLRDFGKIGSSVGMVVSTILMMVVCKEYIFQIDIFKGMLSGIIAFLLTPARFIERINIYNEQMEEDAIRLELRRVTENRLKEFASGFKTLQKNFGKKVEKNTNLSEQDTNILFENISNTLCVNCMNRQKCWQEDIFETYRAGYSILSALEVAGGICEQDIPENFGKKCSHLSEFLVEANRGYEHAKQELIWKNKIVDGRMAVANQLGEIGKIIENFSKQIYIPIQVKHDKEGKIISKLKDHNVEVKNVAIANNSDGKKEIFINARTIKGRLMTSKEASTIISNVLGKKIKIKQYTKSVISRNWDIYSFEEDCNYKILHGNARVTKNGTSISGDNFSFTELSNGKIVMMLSDGMGSGINAYEESELVIDTLEQLLNSGFLLESAIWLVNSMMLQRTEGKSFTTLDISFIDLFTGVVECLKIGASTTFIKRDKWIETIQSTTLPVGVNGDGETDVVSKKLYDKDTIIMVSDGVIDAIDRYCKETTIKEIIDKIDTNSPQEMADEIIEKVTEIAGGNINDDMTVLTLGIWKK